MVHAEPVTAMWISRSCILLFRWPCILCLFSITHRSLLRLIVQSGLEVPTFATRRPHECHHAKAPSGGRWNCGREMSIAKCQLPNANCQMPIYTLHLGIFHMPYSYDMGPTACWGFFFALKIRRLRPGAKPQTWAPKASTLPLDHRSRLHSLLRTHL